MLVGRGEAVDFGCKQTLCVLSKLPESVRNLCITDNVGFSNYDAAKTLVNASRPSLVQRLCGVT